MQRDSRRCACASAVSLSDGAVSGVAAVVGGKSQKESVVSVERKLCVIYALMIDEYGRLTSHRLVRIDFFRYI